MNDDTTRQSVLFSDLLDRPLVAKFDQPHGSSDGGAILLKAADARLGLSERLAACLNDERQAGKVSHSLQEIFRQRMFAIACGYPDGNDAARLSNDPVHKLLCDREAIKGAALASQPTLSRFENQANRKELYRMGEALAETVIERHRRRLGARKVKHITIDLDPTDDPTHGGQPLTFFNGHYDTWCYLPVAGFLTFNHEPEQYLCTYVLRAGNAPAKQGALGILSRLIERRRAAFPRARFLVRLDGGFAGPDMFDFLEGGPRRVRGGDGRKQGAFAQKRVAPARGAQTLEGERADRARLWRVPLRGREVGPQAAHRDQGGSRAVARA